MMGAKSEKQTQKQNPEQYSSTVNNETFYTFLF